MTFIDACPWKTTPFDHQLAGWRRTRDLPFWARLWEQGTGKSLTTIMEAAWLYSRGTIDAMVVMAPNGVHINWVTDEVPAHWPKELGQPLLVQLRTEAIETKWHQKELREAIEHKGFVVLVVSYDALDTHDREAKHGVRKEKVLGARSWLKEFLLRRLVMLIADEASRIKTPTSIRSVTACKASLHAKVRRVLNGTPVPNGPFDIYSQICFLDPIVGPRGGLQGRFWLSKGISSFQGFKTQFGVWETGYHWIVNRKTGEREQKSHPVLSGFKNLELLNSWLAEISDRVLKEDVLDLPPKLYKTMRFDLSAAQRRVYNDLRDEALAFLTSGELITATLVLTRMLRLQQVASGYVAVDDPQGEPVVSIGDKNPRLDLLMEVCEDLPHRAIIWTRFRRDIDLICEAMTKREMTFTRYDGSVDTEGRLAAREAFKTGGAQFFVSNPAAGGEGLTLLGDQSEGADESLACKTVIYYSNGFNLQHRLQSEDRAHRIGQRWPVQYIDIVANNTVDERIVQALRDKFDVAQQVTGDRFRAWLDLQAPAE